MVTPVVNAAVPTPGRGIKRSVTAQDIVAVGWEAPRDSWIREVKKSQHVDIQLEDLEQVPAGVKMGAHLHD